MILQKISESPLRANERYPYLTQEIQNQNSRYSCKSIAEKDGIDPERIDNEAKLNEKYKILAQRSMRSRWISNLFYN